MFHFYLYFFDTPQMHAQEALSPELGPSLR